MGQKGDATHTLNMKRPVPSVSDSPLLCMKMSVFTSMKCPVTSVSQAGRCSGWLCQCSRMWSALCHQCHKQHAALSEDVNIYEHEAPCAFSATDSLLSVWRCQCLCAWSALCLQCHRRHAALCENVNVHEHEVTCAINVIDSALLCLTMSMFTNMKCPSCAFSDTDSMLHCLTMPMFTNMKHPVTSVSQTACSSVWQCQCLWTWSALCPQCRRQHTALCEDVNVYEHEVPCAFSVPGSTLLCLTMPMFRNMKCPVPSVSQTACSSFWRCQCLQMMSCVHDKKKTRASSMSWACVTPPLVQLADQS